MVWSNVADNDFWLFHLRDIAQTATTAPLNPAYPEEEYDFYLSDLNAKALVMDGEDGPAVAAATKSGMAIVRVKVPEGAAAGYFQLTSDTTGSADTAAPADDDVALILRHDVAAQDSAFVPIQRCGLGGTYKGLAGTDRR